LGLFFLGGRGNERQNSFLTSRNVAPYYAFFFLHLFQLPISLILGGLAMGNLFQKNSLAGVNVSQEKAAAYFQQAAAWKGFILF
jgi:hypothetical protein